MGAALGRLSVFGRISLGWRRGLAGARSRRTPSRSPSALGRAPPRDNGSGQRRSSLRRAPPGIASRCGASASAPEERVAYPIAVAAAASGHGLPLRASLEAFALAQTANLVSAALRLGPIGQTDGQRILAALFRPIRALAREAHGASLADLGGAAFRSDIAAMRHESQYSRLFRS